MFSFKREKNLAKRAVCTALALLFLAGSLFISCSNSTNGDDVSIPSTLKGTWICPTWGDEVYTISGTSFSTDTGFGEYAGKIVNHRDDGAGAGYLTIKYTKNDNDTGAVGKYYVLHYQNLTSSTAFITGAYNASDPDFAYPKGGGKAKQSDAEATYTVDNGYFTGGSNVNKLDTKTFPKNKMKGNWIWEDDDDYYTIAITERFVRYSYYMDMMGYEQKSFVGEIVKVQDNGATGYIVFRFVAGYGSGSVNIANLTNGTYTVLVWENYNATAKTARMAVGGMNSSWSGVPASGITTKSIAEAEAKYITASFSFNKEDLALQ